VKSNQYNGRALAVIVKIRMSRLRTGATIVADEQMVPKTKPMFFATPADFRAWLEQHHAEFGELWVGFHKRDSAKPSITWPESVDCALCFGWIDGVRKSLGKSSYMIRFTPRKSTSTWSAINISKVQELTKHGLMHAAGLAAFEKRSDRKSEIYAYEQRKAAELDSKSEKQFRANKKAWEFFQSQPPWYRRTATYWVINAKREETKQKRLATLFNDCAHGRRLRHLDRERLGKR
jgi:uncharacterized protein YdeI (YjbR/CyaY-like superfamily)